MDRRNLESRKQRSHKREEAETHPRARSRAREGQPQTKSRPQNRGRSESRKRTPDEKVTVNLIKENDRRVNVYIKGAKSKSDVQIAEAFWKYGPVEYVFRLEESIIICFLKQEAAAKAMRQERHTVYRARPATCQKWTKGRDDPLPYTICNNCRNQISSQGANKKSHKKLCGQYESQQADKQAEEKDKKLADWMASMQVTVEDLLRLAQKERRQVAANPHSLTGTPDMSEPKPKVKSLLQVTPLLPPAAFEQCRARVSGNPTGKQALGR